MVKIAPAEVAFIPRTYQWGFCRGLATESKRHFLEIWPRRHGKDRCFLNAAAQVQRRRDCTVWHCFPEYEQGRKAWLDPDHKGRRMVDDLLEQGGVLNRTELTVTFENGAVTRVVGSDRYNSVVGAPPYIVGYSEFSRADPMARGYFMPMLLENQGIECFMSTVFGENHLTDLADAHWNDPLWHYSFYTIEDTRRDAPGEDGAAVISQADLDELRAEWEATGGQTGMSPELVAQEFYNDRSGVNTGKVYGQQLALAKKEGRVTQVPHDPKLLVHTFWDRGVHNRVWFVQRSGPRWHVIDCLQTDNSALPAIVAMMREEHRARYNYGRHVMPADAHDRTPGHDQTWYEIAVAQGLDDGGQEIEVLERQKQGVNSGIEAAKAVFPLCWFDAERCRSGLVGLDLYHYVWDDARRRFSEEPRKDGAAHWADAFRYFAVAAQREWDDRTPKPPRQHVPRGPDAWMG